MRHGFMIVATLVVLFGTSVGCATKGYVRNEIGYQIDSVGNKVETLSGAVEETQERTRKNEARIGEVNETAVQAGLWAKNAEASASTARTTAETAREKVDAVDRASKRLLFEVVLSENQGNFSFASAELPPSARARIDQLVADLKANPRGELVEIEGHTDATGSKAINDWVGLTRAEAVKRYLYEKHRVPLHKMSVISYGEDKPVAPNTTAEGRARNRRVVIKVIA